jgi:hypothetical protein
MPTNAMRYGLFCQLGANAMHYGLFPVIPGMGNPGKSHKILHFPGNNGGIPGIFREIPGIAALFPVPFPGNFLNR